MLRASVVQIWYNLAPMFTMLHDILKNGVIFCCWPSTTFFSFVEMIQPSLATLLWSPETLPIGVKEHSLRDLVPSSFLLHFQSFQEVSIFNFSPILSLFALHHVEVLELQKLRIFVEEHLGKLFPKGFILN